MSCISLPRDVYEALPKAPRRSQTLETVLCRFGIVFYESFLHFSTVPFALPMRLRYFSILIVQFIVYFVAVSRIAVQEGLFAEKI